MNKFEVFQKKCLKWILSEQELSYESEVDIRKCKQVNILPLFCRFNLNDMNLFHKIVYKTIPINMRDYIYAPFQLRLSPWCFDASMTCSDAFGRFYTLLDAFLTLS